MTIEDTEHVDLATPSGPMRTHLFGPTAPGKYPGILLYSEIFQVTGPIRRKLGEGDVRVATAASGPAETRH